MKQAAQIYAWPTTGLEVFSTNSVLNPDDQLLIKGGNGEEETTEIVSEDIVDH